MKVYSHQWLVWMVLCGFAYTPSAMGQISPPPGAGEVRYDGNPRVGDYPPFLFRGEAVLVDLDGHDRMDLIMAGLREPLVFEGPHSGGYGGIFTHRSRLQALDPGVWDTLRYYERRAVPEFTDFYNAVLAIGDHDNNGRPDIAASGRMRAADFTPFSMLVEQVDSLAFSIRDPGWLPVNRGSMAWGDYNNDGRSDMLLTGQTDDQFVTRLYENVGGGLFQDVGASLPDIGFGQAVWGDSDNDGDLDILLSGVREGGTFISGVYVNDGGLFTRVNIDLPAIAFGHTRWIDLNGDGMLDILLVGAEQSPLILQSGAYFFANRGENVFEQMPVDIPGHFDGDLNLIDWDTDGDIDILASGFLNPLANRLARLYTNIDGEYEIGYGFVHIIDMFFATGDYDRDHDVDLFVSGHNPEPFTLVPPEAAFFQMNGAFQNGPPTVPNGLAANVAASRVDFSWNASDDDITTDASLTYNIRVGTTPGGVDVVSPLSHPITGKRFVCEQGNVFHNSMWHLESLPPGTYYWSVQAVDQNCVGSAFASEGTFTIAGDPTQNDAAIVFSTRLESNFPNPFSDETTIRFTVSESEHVSLSVHDLLGRRVRNLVDETLVAGRHTAVWKAADDRNSTLPAGLYILRLKTGNAVHTGRVILVR